MGAEAEAAIRISLKDRKEAVSGVKEIASGVKQVGEEASRSGGFLARFSSRVADGAKKNHSWAESAKGVLGGFAAFEGIRKGVDLLKDSAQAAVEDQESVDRLAKAMHNNAGATKAQDAAVESWISKMEVAKGVVDDDLRGGLQRLVQSTHSVSQSQKLMGVAMDVAAGTGKSVTAVATAMAKAHDGNVGALGRLGIATKVQTKNTAAMQRAQLAVSTAQLNYNKAVAKGGVNSTTARLAALRLTAAHQSMEKAQKSTTSTTKSFSQVVKDMSTMFSGQSTKAADSVQGRWRRLSITWDEAKESLGYKLLPVLERVGSWLLDKGVPAISKFSDQFERGEGTAGKLHDALDTVSTVLKTGIGWMNSNRGVVASFLAAFAAYKTVNLFVGAFKALNLVMKANTLGLVVAGVAAVAVGLIYAYKHSETFRDIVNGAFHAIAAAGKFMWDDVLKPTFKFLMDAWFTVVGALVNGAATAFGWVPGIGGKLKSAAAKFNTFRDNVNDALNGIHDKDVKVGVSVSGGKALRSLLDPNRAPQQSVLSGSGSEWSILGDGSIPKHRRRASGGPMVAGMEYVVGEHHAELFRPAVDGYLSPNMPTPAGAASTAGNQAGTSGSRSGGVHETHSFNIYIDGKQMKDVVIEHVKKEIARR